MVYVVEGTRHYLPTLNHSATVDATFIQRGYQFTLVRAQGYF